MLTSWHATHLEGTWCISWRCSLSLTLTTVVVYAKKYEKMFLVSASLSLSGSRSRSAPRLPLSFPQACVRAHEGNITLQSYEYEHRHTRYLVWNTMPLDIHKTTRGSPVRILPSAAPGPSRHNRTAFCIQVRRREAKKKTPTFLIIHKRLALGGNT